jgi:type IV pilus assembly protein PilE
MMLKKQKTLGFTLIELMIVVAIIAILAAIAYPSYQDSVRKTKRADGKAAIVELANFMERFFTENNTYVGAAEPADITSDNYAVTISAQSATAYTLQAAPFGPQTADTCGTMTLTSTNVGNPANCW